DTHPARRGGSARAGGGGVSAEPQDRRLHARGAGRLGARPAGAAAAAPGGSDRAQYLTPAPTGGCDNAGMIVVHHLNNSRSQRVLWLLEELELPYELRHYQRDPRTLLAPPELRAIHPLGKSPVITDGDITLAESGAIIEYLVERYGAGRLAPPLGSHDRLRYL